MIVKKTNKKASKNINKKKSSTILKKSKSKNNEKSLSEKLRLKLKKSEEKIIELNKKYKKIIDIQKQKLENKYKKIVQKLENNLKKSSVENSETAKSNKSKLDKLQKRIELLERKNAKLEAEKIKTEEKSSKRVQIDKDSLKNSIKEIKELRKKLKESEEERKELTYKLKEAITQLKNNKKNKLSKEDKNQFKENIKILKRIKKENVILDKKRELLRKEAEKVKAIRSDIKDSARNIASTIRNSQVNYYESKDTGESNLNPKYHTDSLNITDTEDGLKKLATILCAAMDDYREQKEGKESKQTEVGPTYSSKNKEQTKKEETIEAKPQDANIPQPQAPIPNITVKVEAPKECLKLTKPETQLKPASETPTMRMKLLDDTEDYEKKLVITYGFDNMPENTYFSKYKKILRNAARISLLGNLQEGLDMFKLIRAQNIPEEYKQMIDKNIQDITYYLRGLHRVRLE